MTHAEALAELTSEVDTWMRRLEDLRVHDEKVRGQLEVLRYLHINLHTFQQLADEEAARPPATRPRRRTPKELAGTKGGGKR